MSVWLVLRKVASCDPQRSARNVQLAMKNGHLPTFSKKRIGFSQHGARFLFFYPYVFKINSWYVKPPVAGVRSTLLAGLVGGCQSEHWGEDLDGGVFLSGRL